MLKRFVCGAFMVAALCGTGTFPAQADELYVRNRVFKDAYFLGGTSYVPVDGFLKAARVPWSLNGSVVVVGEGSSPSLAGLGQAVTVVSSGTRTEMSGMVKNGRLYVPTKSIAKAIGYGVIYNREAGVIDVVKSRLHNEQDDKVLEEMAAARAEEKKKKNEAWQARVAKAKELRKAKEEAENKDEDGDDDEATDSDGDDVSDDDSEDMDSKDTAKDMDTKDESKDMNTEDKSKDMDMADKSEKEEPTEDTPPPVAELEVLNTEADPNNYTGEVKFRAVVQNQGYAAAKNIRASFKVVGPDGLTWVNKTIYRGPMEPDARWEITEDYRHRAGAAIPRGEYQITVKPMFDSVPPKK